MLGATWAMLHARGRLLVARGSFASLAFVCSSVLVCVCDACSYEVTVSKSRRSLVKEVALAGLASMLLGFGVLFLLLWAGVWV